MLKKIKKLFLAPLVLCALFAVSVGTQPASFILWYQPKPPVK